MHAPMLARRSRIFFVISALALLALALPALAQVNPALYAGLRWRSVGPFRDGRVSAVTGVIGKAGTYYIGMPQGGIWKTVSAGWVWFPVFDDVKDVSSVGAIEVAPSDANVIYAGTGERNNEGNGIYKSSDAGATWKHIGLTQSHQVTAILVDPHNPNLVLAATEGAPWARSEERGVYRSTDGGQTWTKTLYVDDATGASGMVWAFDNPSVVFATMAPHFTQPGAAAGRGAGGGRGAAGANTLMYKSTDEGATWTQVNPRGLPAVGPLAVAQNTHSQRVYSLSGGIYRSDDGGASWNLMTSTIYTAREHIYVDSKNPDIIYTVGTSAYRSADGGRTLVAFKGAPGGDDPREWWLDPTDSDRILYGGDQGAAVSLDAGMTWSTWYNIPNEQIYKIGVDNQFPYWIYATMQDSCGVATRSRGDLGEITPLDWFPVPAWENGYIVADPANPDLLWTNGQTGIVKMSISNWHWQNVSPILGKTDYRRVSNSPLVFSPQDPHLLYYATQYLTATRDGGVHWQNLSPDLTARNGAGSAAASSAAAAAGRGRGGAAIESLAASPVKAGVVWTGSNNGVAYVTQDAGAHWNDVTPPGVDAASDFTSVEASHFDAGEVFVGVNRFAQGDFAPHIYRTRDFGKTWQTIVTGLPTDDASGSYVRVVREDPVKKGLLFAGTETSMYVSFDDGDHWQSLRLNLPNTSYRDLVIHGNDLIAATYGRSIWILDDISALRQITSQVASTAAAQPAYLFKPGDAIRVHRDVNVADPLIPEVPHAVNPPEGAIIDYYLSAKPSGDIKLEIVDAQGRHVRTLSSTPIAPWPEPAPPVAAYWLRKPKPMSTDIGGNRINWDLRYDPPPAVVHGYAPGAGTQAGLEAVPEDTPATPEGPYALPGVYTVKLTVNGRTYSQPLTVHNDPRMGETAPMMQALRSQLNLELKVVDGLTATEAGFRQVNDVRAALKNLTQGQLTPDLAAAATALDAKLSQVQGTRGTGRGGGGGAAAAAAPTAPTFASLNSNFVQLLFTVAGEADAAPVESQTRTWSEECADANALLTGWRDINTTDLPAFNRMLSAAKQSILPASNPPAVLPCGGN